MSPNISGFPIKQTSQNYFVQETNKNTDFVDFFLFRIIMYSHPSCNNLILMGIILCLLATIPLGMDIQWVS